MLRRITAAPATLVLLLVQVACGGPAPGGGEVPEDPGFRLASLGGEQLGPEDFPGKVVVVDFWATWCAPCHVQADILRGLHQEFRPEDVAFLAVSLGEEESTVRRFVEERPFPYPVLLDPEDALSAQLGLFALPTVMVLDAEGEVVYLEPGISDAQTLRRVLLDAGARRLG